MSQENDQTTYKVKEGNTAVYRATLVNEDEEPIDVAEISALTLTLRDELTREIINGREDQDVLNDNNVTINAAGELTWNIQTEDSTLVNGLLKFESHVALFTWVWDAGERRNTHVVNISVENLGKSSAFNWVERIKSRMGSGRRNIELTADHWREAISQALDLMNMYVWRTELASIAGVTEAQTVIDMSDDPNLIRVTDVQFCRQTMDDQLSNSRFDEFRTRVLQYGGSSPLGDMNLLELANFRESSERVRGTEPDWLWDETGRRLSIWSPAGPYDITYSKAYPITVTTVPKGYEHYVLKAVQGYASLILAEIRGKYGNEIPGPTGPTRINSDDLRQQGQSLVDKVEEALKNAPMMPGPMFG